MNLCAIILSMKSKAKKILTATICSVIFFAGAAAATYLWVLPAAVSSKWVNTQISKEAKKLLGTDIVINNPKLKTGLNSDIAFSIDKLEIVKDNQELLNLTKLNTEFSFSDILNKRLIVKKVLADNIYVNGAELLALFPKTEQQQEQKTSDFNIDIFSAVLGVKECLLTFNTPDICVKFDAKNMLLDRTKAKKYLHFKFIFEVKKGDDRVVIAADDQNRIYMGNGELHVDQFPIIIDKSKIIIDAFASRKTGIEMNISSTNFKARDIFNIITSNLVIPNGKELLAPIGDVNGSVDFNLHLTKDNIRGNVDLNEADFKVLDLENMPVKITQGLIDIGNTTITLKDFKGYYNDKEINNFTFSGDVKDYWKTCDTKIVSNIFVNDDFFKNYVSKMLGAPISLVGDAGSRLTLTSKNGSCDIVWYFLLNEGEGFKLGEQSMVLEKFKTLFKVDLSVLGNILKINTINYYITDKLQKDMTPLLAIKGSIDMADNMKLLDLDLNIPQPLPSEFLNFLACQKIFRKGTISGNLSIDNHGEFPKMGGVIELSKVRVPAQRLYIESAKIGAKDDKLGAIADGKFKRSNYHFDGYILNELRLPIIVKSVHLNVDDIDVEKLIMSANATQAAPQTAEEVLIADEKTYTEDDTTAENDETPTFSKGLIIVEKCILNLQKGKYKDVNFGNLYANLTLDKDGVLELKSNKFDIAEGISTLKVKADLIKKQYYLRLGIKDVNSDVMASAILGLPREISGKARGLIEINSDESLKLNGVIKFDIKDGTIEKVGYVEYILKVASLFRNPLAMITPATFGDLVNIPDGSFDVIAGDMTLKDNVVEKMMIKSRASQLSSFIVGRYDLMTNDATLRIYTKMSNKGEGFAGFLRNISLNSLASRISNSGRNDSNYYASELSQLPPIDAEEKDCQVFLTTVDGDVINFNFLSALKRIK